MSYLAPATRPLVVLYNESWIFSSTPSSDTSSPCVFTADRALLPKADAIAFHLPTIMPHRLPPKQPGQIWIACWMESEVWYPWLTDSQFMAQFDITVSHKRDADVWMPYFGPWVCATSSTSPAPRAGGVIYMQSNDRDRCGRREYVRRLMRRVKIDSYGRSLNNRPLLQDRGRETKMQLFSQYRLTLAFENSIAPDYVTEKFYEPLAAGSVPVYRGAPNIMELAPAPDCFINADKFATPEDLAAYLNRLLADEDEYGAYLAWRERGPSPAFSAALAQVEVDARARLAEAIQRRAGRWPVSSPRP